MQEYKRKNFFTEKKYQIKYTLIIIVCMLLMGFMITATFYWDSFYLFGQRNVNIQVSWDKYLLRSALILLSAFMTGIFFSHKIIGPLSRIEETMKKMNEGDFSRSLKLRTGDEFLGLSNQINSLAAKLRRLSEEDPDFREKFLSEDPE